MEPFFFLWTCFKPNGDNRRVISKKIIDKSFGFFDLLFIKDLFIKYL